ncbi:hypothetical protein O181_007495 [Austropuccinia psidii MF-1]|uniref:Uncharacterized protein n=1 Tax=Austropuccinia psidii MF-1 TaxID=1389203 RepID=A0A9Q3BMI2_9BASI|nr:hypothetical protein [Austropuccinia psidii MF-1]
MAYLGHFGLLWPPRPMHRILWNTLGPFWPNYKEAKEGSPEASNAKWAHLSLFWPNITEDPKKPKLAQGPKEPRMDMASGNHQGPPDTFNMGFPLKIRETSGPTQ